ncbi:MAG: GNAT family N-acetyltransferase [archaeon]
MGLEFHIARAMKDKEESFKVRYKVFCEECSLIDKEKFETGIETDKYDLSDNTFHFVAFHEGKAVGTVRLIISPSDMNGRYGFPVEEIVDLSHYKKNNVNVAEISRSCALPEYRKKVIMMNLWKCTYQFSRKNNITHFCTSAHPGKAEMYGKLGFFKIGEEKKYSAVRNNPALPLMMILDKIPEPYKTFFEEESRNIFV